VLHAAECRHNIFGGQAAEAEYRESDALIGRILIRRSTEWRAAFDQRSFRTKPDLAIYDLPGVKRSFGNILLRLRRFAGGSEGSRESHERAAALDECAPIHLF
jgi:hypothetical protein